ncbi:MAG: hypothetical protein AB8B69_22810 [Chitinophagales bacterium]
MKNLLILLIFCLSACISNDLAAQSKKKYDNVEKRDTLLFAILGSETHSGSECGHTRASTTKPSYNIQIVDVEVNKVPEVETQTMSYQGRVQTQILKPYRKNHTFNFKKTGGTKINPGWGIEVPCYVEEATFTIDLKYKNKKTGKVKPLNVNAKSNRNQMTISVDFVNQKVYSLDNGKKLLGSFNKQLTSVGKKQGAADQGTMKIKVE